ncbi:hypothetical protein [Shewanella surugensis]|uniref:Uncharacterized protein n=1 Tax=Shewanella surugensis TaxID=212020 RepID=A0ABT0LE39_9GAMM|nr:hypothetical protein [Shewanella surugensis]MCL1125972.1 hypothetical protein [Shewanella surugensis]
MSGVNNDLQTFTNNLTQTGNDSTAKKQPAGSKFRVNNVVGYVVGSQTYITLGGGANFCAGARNGVVIGTEASASLAPMIPSMTMSLAEQKIGGDFREIKVGSQKVSAAEEKAIAENMKVCVSEILMIFNKFQTIVKNNETSISQIDALDDSIKSVGVRSDNVVLEARQLTSNIEDTANNQNTVNSNIEQLNTQIDNAINTIENIDSELSTAISRVAVAGMHFHN